MRVVRAVGGWAWTGARKTLLFMAGALRWERRGRRGVGHGLEPVKNCFSWQERCGGDVGGGESGEGGGEWAWTGTRKILLFMVGACSGGGESSVGGEGDGGWAWIGARKILLFMAGALQGGLRRLGMDWSP